MRTIAVIQAIQGHYGEAERFIRRSLEISEKTRGSEHPEVAASRKVFAQVSAQDIEIPRSSGRVTGSGYENQICLRQLRGCERAVRY